MSIQEELEDNRTLREYMEDVEKTDADNLYPEFSAMRKRILAYWSKALSDGKVNLDDPIKVAIQKTRRKASP